MLTLYSKSRCVQCESVKRWLKRKELVEGEDFIIIDAEAPGADLTALQAASYTQVPVVFLTPEDHFYGFDISRLENWFAARGDL